MKTTMSSVAARRCSGHPATRASPRRVCGGVVTRCKWFEAKRKRDNTPRLLTTDLGEGHDGGLGQAPVAEGEEAQPAAGAREGPVPLLGGGARGGHLVLNDWYCMYVRSQRSRG